jgi:polysaccharide biosynthesis protein PslG
MHLPAYFNYTWSTVLQYRERSCRTELAGCENSSVRLPRLVAGLLIFATIVAGSTICFAADGDEPRTRSDPRSDLSPWGIASGAEWFSDYPRFTPLLRSAGVGWLRGFYEWQTLQPRQGYWNWVLTDRLVNNSKANGIHLTFPLAYFAPWASADGGTRKFPIKDMQFWRDYVTGLVSRYHDDIKYWEVWNEFNGSFAQDGTPEIYASLVREAYIAAKTIDPNAKIGMSVANFDVGFLTAAIKAGAADHFDFICVHPYEKLGALENNGEVDFLAMATTLRQMLTATNQRVDTPLWITEIGATAPVNPDRQGDERQASLLVKAYILSIASGFQRVFWFEARGPSYGNQMDHGLIRADFTLRPSYQALKIMTDLLGPEPKSIGWVNLGNGGYGFIFKGNDSNILAAWAPPRQPINVKFDAEVQIFDLTGARTILPAGQGIDLAGRPQFIANLPTSLVEQAKSNTKRPFPWSVDYSHSQVVTTRLQAENVDNGVRQISPDTTLPVLLGDEAFRRTDFSKANGEGHYVYFAISQQFVPFGTAELEITAVVRRLAHDRLAGISLDYESQKGYTNAGYFNLPDSDQWQELTWKLKDANFVGGWGWNFRLNGIASPNDFAIKEIRVKKFPRG